jgi:drug/metabolite transporter (DMT)-like permease
MLIGVLAGLLTGALWALTFVAPQAVQPFTIVDLAITRYGLFGVVSALLLLDPRFRPQRSMFGPKLIIAGLLLGAAYVAYFAAAGGAVMFAGPAIPPLVIGLLPVILAVVGNWYEANVPWRGLLLPLGCIAAGTIVVDIATLADSPDRLDHVSVSIGIGLSLVALALWFAYAILNSRLMRGAPQGATMPWTSLQGIGAGLGVLPLIPWSTWATGETMPPLSDLSGLNFIAWSVMMAMAGSWLATLCWAIASRRLSLALSAQLIVTESVFGLLFGYLYLGRWPNLAEASGAALQVIGVFAAIRLFSREPAAAAPVLHPEDTPITTGSPR